MARGEPVRTSKADEDAMTRCCVKGCRKVVKVGEIRWKEWVNLSCLTGEKRRSQQDNNEEDRAYVHSSNQSEYDKIRTESSRESRERIPHNDPYDSKISIVGYNRDAKW